VTVIDASLAMQLDELHPICSIRTEANGGEVCGAPAKVVAEIHRMDDCEGHPDLTKDGDRVELLCLPCFNIVRDSLFDLACRNAWVAASYGAMMCCVTCGRPKWRLSDYLNARSL
jgi:hypothetical protein